MNNMKKMKIKIISMVTVIALFSCLPVKSQATLAEAMKGKFLFGVAVNKHQVNGLYPDQSELISREFNAVVAENCMKPIFIHPEEEKYDWTDADKLVAFGEKNNHVITGHCLIWHSQIGEWFFIDDNGKDVAPEVLKERMRQHINTVVSRYKGHIKGWDVVNEAFEDDGSYRNSKFFKILGKDFIKYAFQFAREADPDAELYYNDYNVETPTKCDAIVKLVKELKEAGCRIDAVGSQAHMHMDSPALADIESSLIKFKTAGVKVLITEWDISILPNPYSGANISVNFKYSPEMDPYRNGVPDSIQQKWNKRVLDIFSLYLKYNDVIDRITIWGLNDAVSWLNNFPIRGRTDYPVLFDRSNHPKSVVDEMIKKAKI
jgi:endo-1,4-beta-xylanase